MPYKDELEVLKSFLNENLEHYYKCNYRQDDCILGPAGAWNINEVPYITYARELYSGACCFSNGESTLKLIKKEIDRIIDGLYVSKTVEKLEGGTIDRKHLNIHWRQFPEVYTTDDSDGSHRMIVSFRLVVSHK